MIRPSDRRTDPVGIRSRADRQIELEKIALLDGTLLEDVAPNADGAVTIVPHKLGRPWRGWFVTRQKYSGNESFTTTAITPTVSSVTTQTHGLGKRPTGFRAYLVNLTADHGYTAGDVVELGTADSATASRGYFIETPANETDIKLGVSSAGIVILNATTAATVALATPANWSLYLQCSRPRSIVEVSNKTSGADTSKYLYLKGDGFTGTDKVDIWVF